MRISTHDIDQINLVLNKNNKYLVLGAIQNYFPLYHYSTEAIIVESTEENLRLLQQYTNPCPEILTVFANIDKYFIYDLSTIKKITKTRMFNKDFTLK